jgi:flagellar biosynthetic protein FliR
VGGLILARMLGGALAIPFLGGQMIPGRLKFGIPLVYTVFLYPILVGSVAPAKLPEFGLGFFGLVVKELVVGYALGYIVSLPFYAVETAGSFMDTQRGTTFAQVMAPLLGGMTSLLSQLYLLLFISIFLGLGGNHLVIQGLAESFAVLPLLEFPAFLSAHAPFVDELIHHAGEIFRLGLTIAAPVFIAMLLTDVTLGVVNRTAPNVQVFWLGMPLKTLGGLVVVFFALGGAADQFADLTVEAAVTIRRAIILIAGGSG